MICQYRTRKSFVLKEDMERICEASEETSDSHHKYDLGKGEQQNDLRC